MKKRKDIPEQYKWNFKDYYESDDKWLKSFDIYANKIDDITKFNGKLKDKSSILLCFKKLEELDMMAEPLYIYANCLRDVDVSNNTYQEFVNKIESKITEQSVKASFVSPQISALSEEFLIGLLKDKDFKNYTKLLSDIIREKKHTLSEEC